MTGEVLQVQDDGLSWEICNAREDSGDVVGRFCLYETQNVWTTKGDDYRWIEKFK